MITVTDEEESTTDEYIRLPLPNKENNEMFAIADRLMGGSRMNVICADGKSRMARIPGKMRKRVWIRVGDLILVEPWKVQSDTRCDVKWRYTPTQAKWIRSKGILKNI